MHGYARALVFSSFLFSLSAATFANPRDPVNGQITGLALTTKLGASPNLDQFDATGVFVLGSGSDGINPLTENVTVSLDNGRFTQIIPAGSFTTISGGKRYLAPSGSSGITLMKIMTNGDLVIQARKLDLSNMKTTEMGVLSFSAGDDLFSAIPNSVPVAKIVGANAVAVGAVASFDCLQSTDFNSSDTLSFAWSIISQPEGSNVTLSSTANPASSFTASTNGNYTVRCSVNDGVVDGIPALITITASGGTINPPPVPGENNGLIILSRNQPTDYLVGEAATLTLHESVQPGGGNRWFFRSYLDDQPITLTPVPNTTDNSYTTPIFDAPAGHTFRADAFIEDTALANRIAGTIEFFQNDVIAVNNALVNEQDVSEIARLQAQKAYDLEQLALAQEQQELNRVKAGDSVILQFNVVE